MVDTTLPITSVKGIGEKTAKSLSKLGISTTGDMLIHYPRSYVRYPGRVAIEDWKYDGQPCAIVARIRQSPTVKSGKKMQVTLLTIGGGGKNIQIVWYGMTFLKNTIIPGKHYIFYGKIYKKGGGFAMEQPTVYSPEDYGKIEGQLLPVYALTAGVTNNLIIKSLRTLLSDGEDVPDYLPYEIREECNLCDYGWAVSQIHFPDSMEALIAARRRLVFDEFFLFVVQMQYQRQCQSREESTFAFEDPEFVWGLVEKLPYELTGAQRRALTEMMADMAGQSCMQRLLQGDVGSGKTIIAFLAMAWTSYNGYQSAIMAPTEVLARQHFETFTDLCKTFGINPPLILLTGSMSAAEKSRARKRMITEKNAIIIGTHSLFQERAVYSNLAFVVTDEQHRFGVLQRETFSKKGKHTPHILVMSATPIPRTLAIIIYGDLDISVIDEVPAHRLPIKNCVVDASYRKTAYDFIEKQVRLGHQAYVICPMVEASDNMEGENVMDYANMLAEHFPDDICVAVLNGRMKSEKKTDVMEHFAANDAQVLVSTTVVEVGVNVPNATVMMIENAERFGLAQLHQLRGRVGRGDAQSYCIMVNTSGTEAAKERLETLNASNDGFYIASQDLKLRGPGDFFGIRQSGDLVFRLADIYQDADVLKSASDAAKSLLASDPDLSDARHAPLREKMKEFAEARDGRLGMTNL
ncbi:MAG: ATP-dependent DNA helicase RecG [Clostridiales bacterium]|nr:ATP-dependent DNA helicase RecG [Clostridiales bacterium]